MTPIRSPVTAAERNYNRCHIKTRNVVERTIGILKNRFGILSHKQAYNTKSVGNIIVACVILHNMAIAHNDNMPFVPDPNLEDDEGLVASDATGIATRRCLIENYFTQ